MPVIVEICVEGIESALAGGAGGADRIELCEYLAVGGVTPSAGVIALACRKLAIPVHVLIRPRPGDFCYTEVEFEVMRVDIEQAKAAGAAGVVFGLLNGEGKIDSQRSSLLVDAAGPLCVTFHRAFDAARDSFEALEDLIGLGVDRVLTSGRADAARDGLGLLAELVSRAKGRVIVLAGGRVSEFDIPSLVRSGLGEIHVGSGAMIDGKTDAGRVRRLVEIARSSDPDELSPDAPNRSGREGRRL